MACFLQFRVKRQRLECHQHTVLPTEWQRKFSHSCETADAPHRDDVILLAVLGRVRQVFRASPMRGHVSQRERFDDMLQEPHLLARCFEQCHREMGESDSEGNPGNTAAGANIQQPQCRAAGRSCAQPGSGYDRRN